METIRPNYFIGYLPRDYVRYFCIWYIIFLALNLGQMFWSEKGVSLLGLIFTREPFIQMGSYFGAVLAWNYKKAEEYQEQLSKTSSIYFKSVSFLYLTMVVINLISAIYAGTGFGLGLLVVHGYAFYAICFIYTLVALHESRKKHKQSIAISFLQCIGCMYIIYTGIINTATKNTSGSYHGHAVPYYRSSSHGENGYHSSDSRPRVSRCRCRFGH